MSAPQLNYGIDTLPVPVQINTPAQLRLIVSNPKPTTTVFVQSIAIGFTIGTSGTALTDNIDKINAGGFDTDLWSAQKSVFGTSGSFTFTAKNGNGNPIASGGWLFVLGNIPVNGTIGNATITLAETTIQDSRPVTASPIPVPPTVTKDNTAYYIKSFYVFATGDKNQTPIDEAAPNTDISLGWTATDNATYAITSHAYPGIQNSSIKSSGTLDVGKANTQGFFTLTGTVTPVGGNQQTFSSTVPLWLLPPKINSFTINQPVYVDSPTVSMAWDVSNANTIVIQTTDDSTSGWEHAQTTSETQVQDFAYDQPPTASSQYQITALWLTDPSAGGRMSTGELTSLAVNCDQKVIPVSFTPCPLSWQTNSLSDGQSWPCPAIPNQGETVVGITGFTFQYDKPYNILEIVASLTNDNGNVSVSQIMKNDNGKGNLNTSESSVSLACIATTATQPAAAMNNATVVGNSGVLTEVALQGTTTIQSPWAFISGFGLVSHDNKDHQIAGMTVQTDPNSAVPKATDPPAIVDGTNGTDPTVNACINQFLVTDKKYYDTQRPSFSPSSVGVLATASGGGGWSAQSKLSVTKGTKFVFDYPVEDFVFLLQGVFLQVSTNTIRKNTVKYQPVQKIWANPVSGTIDGNTVTVDSKPDVGWTGKDDSYGGSVTVLCLAKFSTP